MSKLYVSKVAKFNNTDFYKQIKKLEKEQEELERMQQRARIQAAMDAEYARQRNTREARDQAARDFVYDFGPIVDPYKSVRGKGIRRRRMSRRGLLTTRRRQTMGLWGGDLPMRLRRNMSILPSSRTFGY